MQHNIAYTQYMYGLGTLSGTAEAVRTFLRSIPLVCASVARLISIQKHYAVTYVNQINNTCEVCDL